MRKSGTKAIGTWAAVFLGLGACTSTPGDPNPGQTGSENNPFNLLLKLTGETGPLADTYVAAVWEKTTGGMTDDGRDVMVRDFVVVQNLVETPDASAPILVPVSEPPPEALHTPTCENMSLESYLECTDNPTDRIASGTLIVYRDLNDNGMLDQIGPGEGSVVDDVLVSLDAYVLVFVESLDTSTFVANQWYGFPSLGFISTEDKQPGMHVFSLENFGSSNCWSCLDDQYVACTTSYRSCLGGARKSSVNRSGPLAMGPPTGVRLSVLTRPSPRTHRSRSTSRNKAIHDSSNPTSAASSCSRTSVSSCPYRRP